MSDNVVQEFDLEPADNERLANLCGQLDEHLHQIENRLDVDIANRGNTFRVTGESKAAGVARDVIQTLFSITADEVLTPEDVHLSLQQVAMDGDDENLLIKTRNKLIRVRGGHQAEYVRNIREYDLSFGVGPAGTGKTYLAVGCAVDSLERQLVRRIILVRPAVEAGERLGFLPGDLAQKVDPYLRPIYDALYEMLGFDRVARFIDRNVIEVAPLAYMRGRTLNESFVILDEAQNTTTEQMKMFLTRIGFGSKAVVTGDITQVDLPGHRTSGLRHAMQVLDGVRGIGLTHFNARDVVRHPLVQRIVTAYEKHDKEQ
ncbi:MAG: PhoH family protein [Gammaproteobacteria bacterium]|nr:PhoH family protein [Gammaproteobacteria bacterium]